MSEKKTGRGCVCYIVFDRKTHKAVGDEVFRSNTDATEWAKTVYTEPLEDGREAFFVLGYTARKLLIALREKIFECIPKDGRKEIYKQIFDEVILLRDDAGMLYKAHQGKSRPHAIFWKDTDDLVCHKLHRKWISAESWLRKHYPDECGDDVEEKFRIVTLSKAFMLNLLKREIESEAFDQDQKDTCIYMVKAAMEITKDSNCWQTYQHSKKYIGKKKKEIHA